MANDFPSVSWYQRELRYSCSNSLAILRRKIEIARAEDNDSAADELSADIDEFIESFARDYSVYRYRAVVHFQGGRYAEALADLNSSLDVWPDYFSGLTWIAPSKIAACPDGEFRDGILQLADRVVELNEGSVDFLGARGRLLAALGDKDRAIADYDKVIELEPDNASVRNNVAWYIASDSDADPDLVKRAVALAKKAVSLDSDSATSWNTLGVAQYRAEEFEGAIESLEKSEELSDGEHIGYNGLFLAMCQARLGQKAQARKWYEKAINWIDAHGPDEELQGFRSEAQQLFESIGIVPGSN